MKKISSETRETAAKAEKNSFVRIMDRNVQVILLCQNLGIDVFGPQDFDREGRIRGALQDSLECRKIRGLCEKHSEDAPEMWEEYEGGMFSGALINVHFSVKPEESINELVNALKAVMESATDTMRKKIKVKLKKYSGLDYEDFIDYYDDNQKLFSRNKKFRTADENAKLKQTYKIIHDAMKDFLSKGHTNKSKELSELRHNLYEDGFTVYFGKDPKGRNIKRTYRVYKRSASKAKTGSCLFIWDQLYEEMINWTWLGLPITQMTENKSFDLTSARAYESLVLSSIEGMVHIDPKNILLIDDIQSPEVEGNLKILTMGKNHELKLCNEDEYKDIHGKKYENRNTIWDGQALLDESVFKEAGYEGNGMMLLRNHFFKACCFNTKITKYYKKYNIKSVTDMFGNVMNASDVKMIVTPDSLKLLKFADDFDEFAVDNEISYEEWKSNICNKHITKDEKADYECWKKRKAVYGYWRKKTGSGFGIVKTEKASHLGHGKYHEVSYQILNTLPLDMNDVEKLMKDDLEYLDMLRNNSSVLLHRLRYIDSSMRKKHFIYSCYKYIRSFDKTEIFNDFLKDELDTYKNNLKTGRLKLRGDYYVLCSMPMEMLEYSANREIKPRLERGEVYIQSMWDGEDVTLFRNPHISSGSVCSMKNRMIDDYNSWFNLKNRDGSNIVVVSPWNSNIMLKLGGADFDSDTALFIKDDIIKKAAGKLMEIKSLGVKDDGLPVGVADDTLKSAEENDNYQYSGEHMSRLDHKLSRSSKNIGSFSNLAQIFNSLFWEEYFKEDPDGEKLKEIYENIIKLSILNELEIDSSKHKLSISIAGEEKKIKCACYKGTPLLETEKIEGSYQDGDVEISRKVPYTVCPYFLYFVSKRRSGKSSYVLRKPGSEYEQEKRNKKMIHNEKYWNCPVDHIAELLLCKQNDNDQEEKLRFKDILEDAIDKTSAKGKVNSIHLKEVSSLLVDTCERLEEINRNRIAEKSERERDRSELQNECLEALRKLKINANTKRALFKRPFAMYSTTKDGHQKGEYKYPEIANVAGSFLGFLLALDEIKATDGSILNKVWERKDLISPGEYDTLAAAEKENWQEITLWGETWYSYNGDQIPL